ncbi:hypothetical protein B0H19DRAFT_1080291 [Mycena capillaripes]|nr:hypothetical protein B0H19DRAFT_1080291 [Mycena capillaripes]
MAGGMGGGFLEKEGRGGGVVKGGVRVEIWVEEDVSAQALTLGFGLLDPDWAVFVVDGVLAFAIRAAGGVMLAACSRGIWPTGGAGAVRGAVGFGTACTCGGGLLALVPGVPVLLAVIAREWWFLVVVGVADRGFNREVVGDAEVSRESVGDGDEGVYTRTVGVGLAHIKRVPLPSVRISFASRDQYRHPGADLGVFWW